MTEVEVEELAREENSLIRSCKVKINGSYVTTPSRAVSVRKDAKTELNATADLINNHYRPFGEVYVNVTLDYLSEIKTNDELGQKFSLQLSNRLQELKEAGTIPYLVLSILDNNKNPYNQLLAGDALELVFNILWGTPGNSVIVPPVLGVLPGEKQYLQFVNALEKRQKESIDRKPHPIMAYVPSSYNLIDPKLLEKYWSIGCRMFSFNCENKKYGAFGYIIEKVHTELSQLSKRDNERYILHALNSKFKVGRKDSSRINNLIGTGYGFDSYGPNHIQAKGSFSTSDRDFFLFNSGDYGFNTLGGKLNLPKADLEAIAKSKAFNRVDLEDIPELSTYKKDKLSALFNVEKATKEIQVYPRYIENQDLFNYLSKKEKVSNETFIMRKLAEKTRSPSAQLKVSKWFS